MDIKPTKKVAKKVMKAPPSYPTKWVVYKTDEYDGDVIFIGVFDSETDAEAAASERIRIESVKYFPA